MGNEDHLAVLNDGIEAWNRWRDRSPEIQPDLSDADLSLRNLDQVNFRRAILSGAHLHGASLRAAMLAEADLTYACACGVDMTEACLNEARLTRADFHFADFRLTDESPSTLEGLQDLPLNAKFKELGLRRSIFLATHQWSSMRGSIFERADLSNTRLGGTNLTDANLREAKLHNANLVRTSLVDVDLSGAYGLETCTHQGPSYISFETLANSGELPLGFLRGCGLPDNAIDYIPSLLKQPLQFYTCFISYSSEDQEFADRLYSDLQNAGVRCWFAPHDLPIGAKTWDGIDEAIRTRDKVLLILSEGAISSDWVEDEVTTAFAEERRRDQLVLFPVRLDNAVMDSTESWARKLRDNRNIGDFTKWKEHDAYKVTLDRVLRDLKARR